VLGAWVLLTNGITAGSYWAYYELGWGGGWFWDPVENASLMPWLSATALLHSVNVLAARGGLRAWTLMLALVAFSMSMIGTFLVRSGILTSVHSFAVDPARGTFILALLLIYIGGALALFAARVSTVREGTRFDIVSREGALVANNLLLSVILGTVFVGTLYPLFVEAVSGEKMSVGPPYFNAVTGPVTLLLALLLFLGPLLRWRRDSRPNLRRVAVPLAVTVLAFAASFPLAPGMTILSRFGLAVAAGLIPASFLPLVGRKLLRTPLATWGMVISHLGVAIALIGAAADSSFTSERLAAIRIGETLEVGPWQVRLTSIEPVAGPNWTALQAGLEARRGGGVVVLEPQSRYFSDPPTETNEAAIDTLFDGQLYTVLGRQDEAGRWQLRLWWKPLVTLIWFGGALIALGGLLALGGRLRREGRRAQPTPEPARKEAFA
jgi:cytochrome c-type biogenesis protein CcmF